MWSHYRHYCYPAIFSTTIVILPLLLGINALLSVDTILKFLGEGKLLPEVMMHHKYFAQAQRTQQSEGNFAQEAVKQASGKGNSVWEVQERAASVWEVEERAASL